jgi:4-amino-4-deoxy-L-arabinose transferase-like glycosyltransferase
MTTRRTQPTQAASGRTPAVPLPGRIEQIWLAALVVVIGLLAIVNLPYAPRTWFDEGSHLHVPKAIVQRGMYADISATSAGEIEYRYHGPTIGIGPTIMLPVALVYKLFGVSLVGGRLVIVLYLLIGLAAAYALARRVHGGAVALLALSLLIGSRTVSYETMVGSGLQGMIANGYEGMIEYGRQVVGEVPGVAFLLLGLIAWWQALQERGPSHVRWALLAGLGFGLTLVTKNQFVLILPPSLALIALLDWRYYRVGTWWLRVAPLLIACICYGIWTLAQFQFLGPGTFMENVQQTRQAAGGAIFVFNIRSTLRAGYYILRPGLYGGLIIPALLYTIWCARQRSARGMVDGLMGLLIGLWVVWYVAVSLGWPRYAFPAVALSAIAIARAAVDLSPWLRRGDG